ncbi:hypothetical protein, partial [Pseudooceanicola nitratireducens]|uniref:hypothetical protein n=1 Tax=Pseudooceanicola nitratireducens TaxID=517719 RepID=UPI0035A2C4DF
MGFEVFEKKMTVPGKKPLRSLAPNRKYPLTGGAEALTGRQTERRSDALEGLRQRTLRCLTRGAPQSKAALPVDFVSTLFEIDGI